MFVGIITRYKQELIDSKINHFVHLNYAFYKKLLSINLLPIIIPFENYEKYLSKCVGFIIPGGNDVNPILYNENNHCSNINDLDDIIDYKVINYAIANKIPILGICRGYQVLNVYFGGSLHQNIDNHFNNHFVEYKNYKFNVNSTHHQAIKKLANNLIPLFKHNNIIESFIHKELPIIGIQWHPERMDDLTSSFIFKYFKKLVLNNIN